MDDWLLGYCISCPDGERPGRIAVVASLRKNAEGEFVSDRLTRLLVNEIGKSGTVFWPQFPAVSPEFSRCLVRFRAEPTNNHGVNNESKDWLKVSRSGNSWEIHRIGFRVIDRGVDVEWKDDPRWVKGRPEGEQIMVRDRQMSTLVGPWRVGSELAVDRQRRELIPHPNANRVFEYAIKHIQHDNIISHKNFAEYLLNLPDESTGHWVDLATAKQLAKWLVDRIISVAPQIIDRLDKDSPGWRGKIRDEIESYGETERTLFQNRWAKIETNLNGFVFESSEIEKLLKLTKFKTMLDERINAEVAKHIVARARDIEAEAQRQSNKAIELYKQTTQSYQVKYRQAKEQYEGIVSEMNDRIETAIKQEQAAQRLIDHLNESRDRLLLDLASYQTVLPTIVQYTNAVNPASMVKGKAPSTTSAVESSGVAIKAASEFIKGRLWPQLFRWFPGIPLTLTQLFHAAVIGSKAIIVPSPAWTRSYVDALGTFVRFTIVNVQPTWLGFDDLWKGGLSECWERAHSGSPLIELVLLRDFNRALPQCYARPLLDIIAGFCDALSAPGEGHWPNTLRLFACPSPPEESLPLTAEVLQHFSAVQCELPETNKEQSKEVDGHVTTETWLSWVTTPAKSVGDPVSVKEFGPLAPSAAAEVDAIANVLVNLGIVEREAKSMSRELRIDNPKQYLSTQVSETKK